MNLKSTIFAGISFIILLIGLTSFIHQSHPSSKTRTEEYAIVDIIQYGKKKSIRVTKGTEPSTETDWKKVETDKRDDLTPIIKVLNQLNEEGYELLNASLAYTSIGGGSTFSYGEPVHSFMMVKKLK